MKSKILALMLALVMVLTLTVSVSAAPSPGTSTTPGTTVSGSGSSSSGSSSGTYTPSAPSVDVTSVSDISKLSPAAAAKLREAYSQITAAGSVATFLSNAGLTNAVTKALAGTGVSISDLAVHSVFDVSADGFLYKDLTLSFDVKGIKRGDVAIVLHFDGEDWDVRPTTVSNGKVTAEFDRLSPVVILVEKDIAPSGSGVVTSPATGGADLEGAVVCGAVLCAAVLVFSLKRRSNV